jgi:hypothetical protein
MLHIFWHLRYQKILSSGIIPLIIKHYNVITHYPTCSISPLHVRVKSFKKFLTLLFQFHASNSIMKSYSIPLCFTRPPGHTHSCHIWNKISILEWNVLMHLNLLSWYFLIFLPVHSGRLGIQISHVIYLHSVRLMA